jgi:hypothetical protein
MQHAISVLAAVMSSGMQLANADDETLNTSTAAVRKRESRDTDLILWTPTGIVKLRMSRRRANECRLRQAQKCPVHARYF